MFVLLALATSLTACAKPTIVPHEGTRYAIEQHEPQRFVYVEYRWKGGSFDDAVELERRLVRWADERGILVEAVGRFPTLRDWQLGFYSNADPPEDSFEGHALHTMNIDAGRHAVLECEGHVDSMFRYWRKFRRWVEADGHATEAAILEVYPDVLEQDVTPELERGQLRLMLVEDAK